jgi:hypothetical protein
VLDVNISFTEHALENAPRLLFSPDLLFQNFRFARFRLGLVLDQHALVLLGFDLVFHSANFKLDR